MNRSKKTIAIWASLIFSFAPYVTFAEGRSCIGEVRKVAKSIGDMECPNSKWRHEHDTSNASPSPLYCGEEETAIGVLNGHRTPDNECILVGSFGNITWTPANIGYEKWIVIKYREDLEPKHAPTLIFKKNLDAFAENMAKSFFSMSPGKVESIYFVENGQMYLWQQPEAEQKSSSDDPYKV